MRLDLSKFKKISSDKTCSVLKHKDGHEFRVAHGALSKEWQSALSKMPVHMAEGGEVKASDRLKERLEKSPFAGAFSRPDSKDIPQSDIDTFDKQAEEQRIADEQAAAKRSAEEAQVRRMMLKDAGAPADVIGNSPAPASAPVAPAQPAIAPLDPQSPAAANVPPPAAPAPQQEVAPQTLAPQAPAELDASNIAMSGIQQQQAGLAQEAAAVGALGQEKAKIAQEQQAYLQNASATYKQESDKLNGEYNAVVEDYKNKHVNPNHFMESRTAEQKKDIAIGLFLGGIGAGLLGTENSALKFLHAQMDRDIEAQKSELGKSETLLSANMRQFGNLQQATEMTKAMQLGITAAKIEEAAGKSASPIAKANALQESGKLKIQAAEMIQKISEKQALTKYMGQGASTEQDYTKKVNALRVLKPEFAKDMEEKLIPGVGVATIKPTDKDRELLASTKQIKDGLTKLQARAATIGSTVPGSEADKENKTLIASIQLQMKNAYQLGVLSQSDIDMLQKLVADPGAVRTGVAIKQLDATKKSMDSLYDSAIKKLGVTPFQQSASSLEGRTATGPNGQKIVNKGGKWVPLGS